MLMQIIIFSIHTLIQGQSVAENKSIHYFIVNNKCNNIRRCVTKVINK